MLSAIPICVAGKGRNASSENKVAGCVSNAKAQKAGVIFFSTHIKRDFLYNATHTALMSGIRGSDFWMEPVAGSATDFCDTVLSRMSRAVFAPGAYGCQGIAGSGWPDLFCDGCVIDIDTVGLSSTLEILPRKRLSVSVELIGNQVLFYGYSDTTCASSSREERSFLEEVSKLSSGFPRVGDFV